MINNKIRILNFDDSLLQQNKLLEKFNSKVVDLKALGPKVRLWANGRNARKIKNKLDPTYKNNLTFLGSGDFHNITGLLLDQFSQPLSLIVFDNHPDWDIMPPKLGCGSWVSYCLRRPNIKNVIIFGVTSEDISTGNIRTGNISSLKNNRVLLYPYQHLPTTVNFRKVPENKSIVIKQEGENNIIYWQELKTKNLESFIPQLLTALDTKQVYVSIDKDCLSAQYALTNWEEGKLSLNDLLKILAMIKQYLDIVGLDITGEYSPTLCNGLIRKIVSYFDHPKDYSAYNKSPMLINSVNEETNLALVNLIFN